MPLTAVRHVRKMRGGAQAHLLEADDGNWYVVKFRNNPQHHRVLVNELLSATFLEYLKNIIPDGMIFQAEFDGDIVVLLVFRYELYDLTLPWGQQSVQRSPARMYRSQIRY